MFVRRILFLSLLAVVLAVSAVGLWWWRTQTPPTLSQPVVTFSPKWVNQAQFAGVFVARDKGLYEREGLQVEIDPFVLGDSVLTDLKSGTSQIGLMSANEFLKHYSEGEPLKAVAAFYQVSPFMVASLRATGIESPAQLKGRLLGVKGGSGGEGELAYGLLLASAGLEPEDVQFVNLPFGPTEAEDLLAERADTIGFYRTRISQFDDYAVPVRFLYPEQYGAALYNDVVVVTEDFLAEHPDVVRAFLKGTIEGWKDAYAHKEDALATTMRYVTEEEFRDIDYQREILTQSEPLMIPNGDRSLFGAMDLPHWQRFYDALFRNGFLAQPFDVREAFTTAFLP